MFEAAIRPGTCRRRSAARCRSRRRSPTRSRRRHALVDLDAAPSRLDADRLESEAPRARPPAGGDQQPVAAQLGAVGERERRTRRPHAARRRRAGRSGARRRRPRAPPSASPSGAARAAARAPSFDEGDRRAHAGASACAISTPTGPAPRMSSRPAPPSARSTSRLVQTPSSPRSPSIGGITGSEPVATRCASRVAPSRPTSTAPGPVSAPCRGQLDPFVLEPFRARRVVVARDLKSRHASAAATSTLR